MSSASPMDDQNSKRTAAPLLVMPATPAFAASGLHAPLPTRGARLACRRRETPVALFGLFKKRVATVAPRSDAEDADAVNVGDAVAEMVNVVELTPTEGIDGAPAVVEEVTTRAVPPFVLSGAYEVPEVPAPEVDVDVVLVVGAAGMLGREIVRVLLERRGVRVVACVRSMGDAEEAGLIEMGVAATAKGGEEGMGVRMRRVDFVCADCVTETEYIAECAKKMGVGSVVFAASGGADMPGAVDNAAVGSLVTALEPVLGASGASRTMHVFNIERDGPVALSAFRSVDDVVMGGMSRSQMVMSEDGKAAVFCGNVTTARNGGFAQARGSFGEGLAGAARRLDLSQFAGISVRVRGDGRQYKINLKDEERPEAVFQCAFGTTANEWQNVRLPFSEFVPVKRGRLAYRDGPGIGLFTSSLDTSNLVSVGFVVSKIEPGGAKSPNFESGPFRLEISHVSAYKSMPPRFVLVSSAAVTRPFWSSDEKALNSSFTNIPIVKLNPSNILGHKLAGENALRRSTIPWAIVRPVGLNDNVSAGRALVLRQGDVLSGTMNRKDAAIGITATLLSPATTWKTFELGAQGGARTGLSDTDFAKLKMDVLEAPYAAETDGLLKV